MLGLSVIRVFGSAPVREMPIALKALTGEGVPRAVSVHHVATTVKHASAVPILVSKGIVSQSRALNSSFSSNSGNSLLTSISLTLSPERTIRRIHAVHFGRALARLPIAR